MVVPENPAVPAVRVALVALENPAVPAVRVALPVLARQLVAALVRQVRVAPVRQLAAALVSQVAVAEKEAQTRSVAISRRGVAAAAPSLAAVGALLKRRAGGVAVS